ncbi:hypothetical protein CDV31_015465 [Fusarium ambrosium]|uniref:Zn(2)-C6 fungal-type domain-containing protein n=1 Tax=Fusarium ambrosium TaxID=131363 RepID=A0A428SNR1_9HYPO|nr:hypothetical protein CDV31_015465 [Fusarium ambrosium]
MSESSTTSPRQEDSPPVSHLHPGGGNPPVYRPAANQDWAGHAETQSKRRRLNTTDFAQRKRAAEACQFCRVRKTKCDSARPRCGFCVRNNATCIYKEVQHTVETIPVQVQHEAAPNAEVIARLEEIKEILLRGSQKTYDTSSPTIATDPPETDNIFPATTPNPWARFSHIANNSSSKGRRFPYAALRCEGLLKWPCLADVIPQSATNIDSFLFSPEYREVRKIQGTNHGRGINEHALVPLCEKFLITAHPRNPILDDQELLCHARRATGHGLDWDSSTCLVLLACALGSYATPWIKPREQLCPFDEAQLQALTEAEDQDGAEAYYVAAQKRLGLLGNSIQDIQCFFLAGMFEKTALRPLRAWHHIQQACSRLVTRLLQRGERPSAPFNDLNPENHHLEQRLFWSCLRAESELVFELGETPGNLENFSYPDAFPSPPDNLFDHTSPNTDGSPPSSIDRQRRINEQGWYYYLAEISVRRTVDETLNLLYSQGPEYWMENPAYLIRQYYECEGQVSSWHRQIPTLVQFEENVFPDDELAQGLQARASLWREYTLRPILYYVLHAPEGQDVSSEALSLAAKEIQICVTTIQRCSFYGRHGGIWFVCRNIFTAACLILAAALHPHRVQPPPEWQGIVKLGIQILGRWGQEAQDVKAMRDILDHIYQEILRK